MSEQKVYDPPILDSTGARIADALEARNDEMGALSGLTTDAKTSLAEAINEVDAHADKANDTISKHIRRTRQNITSHLTNLITAIAEQDLEKYGYTIGDYFVGTNYTYHTAHLDPFYGGYTNNAVVNTHHIGIVVNTGASSKWNDSNDTSTGYFGSVLHTYLKGTVLDNIKADMKALFGGSTGLEHLLPHNKLLTTATSSWAWKENEYISALTEVQIYGSTVWSLDGYQTGEGCLQLEIFRRYRFNEILGNIWFWLRSIKSASYACCAHSDGLAYCCSASGSCGVVGLILFY